MAHSAGSTSKEKAMKVLVTGGAGFIGSHVTDWLIKSGAEVVVLDNLSSGNRASVNPQARLYEANICDEGIRALFEQEHFDCVDHHAAQMNVRRSVDDPVFDARVNILGSLNLLQAAAATGVQKFVFASTGGAIYGEQLAFPADEAHQTCPMSPYGVAKLAVEKYLAFYDAVHGLPYAALRYANVYGPRQDPHGEAGVVAIFSQRLLAGETPIINGDGAQTRDFVYVEDVVRANVLAVTTDVRGTYNVGTGVETSVTTLYAHLARHVGSRLAPHYGPAKAGEQRRSVLDCRKLQAVTNWRPTVSLDEGLERTVAYFAAQVSGRKTT
jgi:UDP-glucose 4-epimerase